MDLTARSHVTAAAVLAAGSLIAVTPTGMSASALSDVQARAVQLTSGVLDTFLTELQANQIASNAELVTQVLANNANLVTGNLNFEAAISPGFVDLPGYGGSDDILNGALNSMFNAGGDTQAALENSFLGLIGADFNPETVTSTALTGTGDLSFQDGAVGGLWGSLDNSLFSQFQLVPVENGIIDNLTGTPGTLVGPTLADFTTLDTSELTAAAALVSGEGTFNADLLTNETDLMQAVFGVNTTVDPVFERMLNADNLLVGLAENSANSLLGVTGSSSSDIYSSLLLTPADGGLFDAGNIGGLTGVLDQTLAAFNDASGLTVADYTNAFANFDPTAFNEALTSLLDPTAFSTDFSAFFSDLTPIFTDLSTIMTSFF